MSNESKLKPCPFCGKAPTIRKVKDEWYECILAGQDNKCMEERWWVSCETEHCLGHHVVIYGNKNEAIKEWNRRIGG